MRLGLETAIVNQGVYDNTVQRFREAQLRLPTFAELTRPERIPLAIQARLVDVDPDAPHPLNLFRVDWYNDASRRGRVDVPLSFSLPWRPWDRSPALTASSILVPLPFIEAMTLLLVALSNMSAMA